MLLLAVVLFKQSPCQQRMGSKRVCTAHNCQPSACSAAQVVRAAIHASTLGRPPTELRRVVMYVNQVHGVRSAA